MEITLKKCQVCDAALLREIAIKTYDETFKAVNTEENMRSFYRANYSLETLSRELEDENSNCYFIYASGVPAGFLKVNADAAQTDIYDENALELQRIYILKEFHGKGLAGVLMQKTFDIARELGKKYIWLGVWEKNFRAQNFYKKYGFYKISSHPFVMGDDVQTDWILKKDLK